MIKSKLLGLTAFVAVLLFVLGTLPTAEAQQGSTLSLGGFSPKYPAGQSSIRPGADTAIIDVPFSYNPQSQLQNAVGVVSSTVTVTATPKNCSTYIQIIGSLSKAAAITPQSAGTPTPVTDTISFGVTLKPDAPGLEGLACTLDVQALQVNDQFLKASNVVTTSFTVKGSYIPLVQANVANGKLKTAGPQKEVPYQLELTNFGNAKTVVAFAITNEPGGSKWEALAPEQITLNTEQSGLGNKQTIPFIVSTTYKNGWNNAVGGYTLEMTPVAFIDPNEKGTPTTVNVLARVRGVYVPGLEPFVMLGALLGAALLVRRPDEE